MHIPRRYEEKDKTKILQFLRENSFGLLITVKDGLPIGTHIPFVVIERDNETFLSAHISKGNEQKFTLQNEAKVLVVFSGPHAYISPRWYTVPNVPTWNYISVHIYGTIRIVEEQELKAQLSLLMNQYETHLPNPLKIEHIPEKIFNDDLRGIIGFEIKAEDIQAAYKLSQNRDLQSYENVIDELSKQDELAKGVAEEMMERKDKLFNDKKG